MDNYGFNERNARENRVQFTHYQNIYLCQILIFSKFTKENGKRKHIETIKNEIFLHSNINTIKAVNVRNKFQARRDHMLVRRKVVHDQNLKRLK